MINQKEIYMSELHERFYRLSNGTYIDLLMAKSITPLLSEDKGGYGVYVERFFQIDNVKIVLKENTLLECDTSELEAEVKGVQEQWRRVKCLTNS